MKQKRLSRSHPSLLAKKRAANLHVTVVISEELVALLTDLITVHGIAFVLGFLLIAVVVVCLRRAAALHSLGTVSTLDGTALLVVTV